jgi:hypothetical protein
VVLPTPPLKLANAVLRTLLPSFRPCQRVQITSYLAN